MQYDLPPEFDTWSSSTQRAYIRRLEWLVTARPEQLPPPGEWSTWLLLAGRGFGKTRTAAEDMAHYGLSNPNTRLGVIAGTFGDVRDTCIEGQSGLLSCLPPEEVDVWNRSLGELKLKNGSFYKGFSAEDEARLRGPQFHRVWCDELAAWKNQEDIWTQVQLTLRLPPDPRCIVTTTPRPTKLIKRLVKEPTTVITRGSTFANAKNLAPSVLRELQRQYGKTRIGRQELYAEILSAAEDAIIKPDWWGLWEREDYPEGDMTIASLDTAYTKDKENDASCLTIWRVYVDERTGLSRILLIYAWKGHYEFNELVHRVIDTCDAMRVDRAYVEGKANGLSIIQELRRRTNERRWMVHQVNPKGDKLARAHAVSNVFASGVVWAPPKKWAQMVIDEVAEFPTNGRDVMDSVSQAISEIRRLGLRLFGDEDWGDETRREDAPAIY